MKLSLPRGKRRNAVTLSLVVLLALLLLAGNLLLPYALRRANAYIDLTPEGLYTLTDALKEELSALSQDVEIVFLADEDLLLDAELTRYTYVMCRALEKENEHITVKTVNLAKNPSAADDFRVAKGTELATSDVVVHSAGRYKVLSAASFFTTENNEYVSYNGEYRIATAILSVTTYANGPYAYFATGHGERYYVKGDAGSDPSLSAFAALLEDAGLRVGKVDLDAVDAVPEDCVLLIFLDTAEDYSAGDLTDYHAPSVLKKLDKYLYGKKSVMVFRDALDAPLPDFEEYLAQWGIRFTSTHVTSPEEALADSVSGEKNGNRLVASYPDADADAPAYAMVKDIASMITPPKMVIANAAALQKDPSFAKMPIYTATGTSRSVCPVFYAGEKGIATYADGTRLPTADRHILAMVGMEARLKNGEHTYSYVFAAGSTEMIANEYLLDGAFGNGDVMAAVLRTITRTDVYASGEVGGFDLNANYGGKLFEETHLSTEGKNEIFLSLTEWRDYAQLTPARVTVVCVCLFAIPLVGMPLLASAVLRRRKNK